jgi:ABC-type antimicrobial peptide transport system permease subunit
VLRAVGWSSGQVLAMIIGESFLLSLIGGLFGLGLGVGLTRLVANLPTMTGLVQADVPPSLIIQSLSAAIVLGLVGGAYPAWHASRLPPIRALSYDGGGAGNVMRIPFGGMAVKSLARQRTRTLLTMVGVGIAVLAMLLIGSLGEGTISGFNQVIAGAEITAMEKDQPDSTLSTIDERTLKRVEAMPEVQYVSGLIFAVVSTSDNAFFIITARSRTDPQLSDRILREGQLLTGRRQMLLGWKAAQEMGRGVGDRVQMLGTHFTVVGIVSTGNAFEDNGAVIELREAQRLLKKPRQVMAMQIKLRDPERADEMSARLSAMYPKLLFSQSAEFAENLPDMQDTRSMIDAIFVLTTLVGSVAMMNTMIMSIYERTREIGVLRSVGWRRWMILRQIISEALLLTLSSGALGALVTYGIVLVVQNTAGASVYRDLFAITPGLVGQTLVYCLLLGLLGGLYPAWRATRFSPVEALRYE